MAVALKAMLWYHIWQHLLWGTMQCLHNLQYQDKNNPEPRLRAVIVTQFTFQHKIIVAHLHKNIKGWSSAELCNQWKIETQHRIIISELLLSNGRAYINWWDSSLKYILQILGRWSRSIVPQQVNNKATTHRHVSVS